MPLLPILVATGCVGAPVEEAEPAAWEGPIRIDEVVIDCDGSRSWTYDVWTEGFGGEITVDVVARRYGALLWTEHHPLPEIERGEDRAHHQAALDQVTSEAEVVGGESTGFSCQDKTLLTYGIAAWREEGTLEECVAWGLDPVGEFPGCADWGQTGH